MNWLTKRCLSTAAFAFFYTLQLTAQTVSTTAGLIDALFAANAVPGTPMTISLAAGTYNLATDMPTLAANGLTLRGPSSGAPAIIDAAGLAAGVVFNVTADQVVIANLTIRNARQHAVAIHPGADSGRVENCAMSTTVVPLPTTPAIDGRGCQNWVITGNSITGIGGTSATARPAIHFYGGASATVVSNNLVLNCDRALGLGGDPVEISPVISQQPLNTSITAGEVATFSVVSVGTPPPVYQWRKNGLTIAGATSATYKTPVSTLGDNASVYTVAIANSAGSVTSAGATLTVAAGRRTQHYVDPVNGSDTGDGSLTSPWKTLQTIIDQKVETRTWTTLPYVAGATLVPVNAGAVVQPGDTIWLKSGYYGPLVIRSAYNAAHVTVASMTGETPRFSNVQVQSSQNWTLRGFTVSPSFASDTTVGTIVTVDNHSWRGPASDVVIDGFEIHTVPDESVWTIASDWDTKAFNGFGASGARVVLSNSRIRNVDFAVAVTGVDTRVERNVIDGFAGDGIRGLGDGEVFEYNIVKNRREVNGNHPDGFQSWSVGTDGKVGTGVVRNITIRGNVFIAYERNDIPFKGSIQGIGCFDGMFDGWVVENNVVITDHWHGISLYGALNCRVVNNTVVDIDTATSAEPWIMLPAHKNGTLSQNCVVRNNLTSRMNVSADTTNNMVVDNNLLLPTDMAGYFVDIARFNARLAAGSPAIDKGVATLAPAIDADVKSRPKGAAFDIGAYEYEP